MAIIDARYLWARVIDLNVLGPKWNFDTPHQRNPFEYLDAILTRVWRGGVPGSGPPISVTATMDCEDAKDNWMTERLNTLIPYTRDLRLHVQCGEQFVFERLGFITSKSAPHLQQLFLCITGIDDDLYYSGTASDLSLFKGEFPIGLRTLDLVNIPFWINAPAPMAALTSLCLADTSYFGNMTTASLYDILSHTPLLQSLEIRDIICHLSLEYIDDAPIDLPYLKELRLSSQFDDSVKICWDVLKKISIAPTSGCSLYLSIKSELFDMDDFQGSECLVPYINSYFKTAARSTTMHFTKHNHLFRISDPLKSHGSFFEITIESALNANPNIISNVATIFSEFTTVKKGTRCDFSNITHLELDFADFARSTVSIRRLDQGLVDFLHLFTSVQTLRLLEPHETLKYLLQVDINCFDFEKEIVKESVTFPMLRTLILPKLQLRKEAVVTNDNEHDEILSHFEGSTVMNILFLFLSIREVDLERPIQTLDFTLSPNSKIKDFSFLEDLKGLIVKWSFGSNQGQYVCGSNRLRELDLTHASYTSVPSRWI